MSNRKRKLISRHEVRAAEARLMREHRNVVGVAIGSRMQGGNYTDERVLTVFVRRKPNESEPLFDLPIPRTVTFRKSAGTVRLRTDVVAVGEVGAEFHDITLGSALALQPGGTDEGCIGWLVIDASVGITAEHVVGFGGVGTELYAGGRKIGQVRQTAYGTGQLDAARFDVSPGVAAECTLGGTAIDGARYVSANDIYNGGNAAWVVLPSTNMAVQRVHIRHVHVPGQFPIARGTQIYYPSQLILTDPVTVPGDSGSVLIGNDGRAIGIVCGKAHIDGQPTYSLFTELGSALDILHPSWG